jgi:Phosphate-selective porin O and P
MKRFVLMSVIGIAALGLLAQSQALAQSSTGGPSVSFGVPTAYEPIALPMPEANSRRMPLDVFWDNGLRFESKDDQFHVHVGGTLQVDSTWLIGPSSVFALPSGGANGVGNASATFLRRARLRADGDIFGLFDFVIEYDFANASNENSGGLLQ